MFGIFLASSPLFMFLGFTAPIASLMVLILKEVTFVNSLVYFGSIEKFRIIFVCFIILNVCSSNLADISLSVWILYCFLPS